MPISPFTSVTKVAIEEMIRERGSNSKFGLFISDESLEALVGDLLKLMETSRNLKAAGDKFLRKGPIPQGEVRRNVR